MAKRRCNKLMVGVDDSQRVSMVPSSKYHCDEEQLGVGSTWSRDKRNIENMKAFDGNQAGWLSYALHQAMLE